jgi:transposase
MEVWDQGLWRPLEEVDRGLRDGKLKFEILGDKISGTGLLVRSGNAEELGMENWLLIRQAEPSLPTTAPTTVGKTKKLAAEEPLPSWIEPQLATLAQKPPSGDRWLHEIKFDGYRMQCRIELGDVRFTSRNGKDWTDRFPHLVRAATRLPCDRVILDGEVVRLLPSGISSFQSLQSAIKEGKAEDVRTFGIGRKSRRRDDSTTVTFFGAYAQAAQEKLQRGRPTWAITWGHNKDHRPDLKQLLYILTVSEDGGVPVHFQVQSGNVTDDRTHQATWDLLCQLVGRRDFLYVADAKLATAENMAYVHQRGGRFVTVLPRTRAEDGAFRELVRKGLIAWRPLWDKTDEEGNLLDRYSLSTHPAQTAEGYRLLWYHSTRKAEWDALARSGRIERALKQLAILREKLRSPRTRYRQQAKVAAAVEEVLRDTGAEHWIAVTVQEQAVESYHQEHRGRAGKDTRYIKKVVTRFDLEYRIDDARVAEEARGDGLFPLVSNVLDLSEQEILWSYKRQPTIEKRFSQLKTDYEVAPVYLKEVRRIQALLCLYFLALLVEALVERELRQAMKRETTESLPLYPEGRPCRCPTTRRLLDVFDLVQRHTLQSHDGHTEVLVTELTDLQRKLLKLLGIPSNDYGR